MLSTSPIMQLEPIRSTELTVTGDRLGMTICRLFTLQSMSIIEAYNEAWDTGNVEALANIIHDDCVFNPHVGGITMSKADILGFAGGDGRPTSEHNRILFENDEVGVAHSIVHFANDSDSEAVMSFMRFKDGQIILMETGATPLSDDYQLIGN